MLESLFFSIAYLILGMATAFGVRTRGIWNWTHDHYDGCHTCARTGIAAKPTCGSRFEADTDNHCFRSCIRSRIGGRPIAIKHWAWVALLWPVVDAYIGITWLIRTTFYVYDRWNVLDHIGEIIYKILVAIHKFQNMKV